MKRTGPITAALFIGIAGAAQAGSTGAGPAASAAPAVGSTITPGSQELLGTTARDEKHDRVLPGNGGEVQLTPEEATRIGATLKSFEGARVENNVIRAPTVMADGTPAMIALDTRTGRLSVTRQER